MADTPATHSDPEMQAWLDECVPVSLRGLWTPTPYDLAAYICNKQHAAGELGVDEIELAHHDYETRARRLLT